jgi:hypothetical protein
MTMSFLGQWLGALVGGCVVFKMKSRGWQAKVDPSVFRISEGRVGVER